MAGKAQRGSRHRGQSSRHDSPLALATAASAGEPGTEATSSTANVAPARDPQTAPSQARTPQAVWRLLQMKGMTPDEAANLTAFLHGLPTSDLRWTVRQLNQLLFLRQMHQTGRVGGDDGGFDLPA